MKKSKLFLFIVVLFVITLFQACSSGKEHKCDCCGKTFYGAGNGPAAFGNCMDDNTKDERFSFYCSCKCSKECGR
jgi:hypothetical protein